LFHQNYGGFGPSKQQNHSWLVISNSSRLLALNNISQMPAKIIVSMGHIQFCMSGDIQAATLT